MLRDSLDGVLAMIASLPPVAGFLAIVLATFILEDVAIVSTALLASTGMLEPVTGLTALLIGIVLGDLGLFGLGYGAARTPVLRRYVNTQVARRFRDVSARGTFSLVFSTRFVPGMRLPTYTSLGYVGASFWRFLQAVLFAVSLWTVALYGIILFLGKSVLDEFGAWKYAAIGVIIVIVILVERTLIKRRRAKVEADDVD
ncbi:MAG: VTT domain-containing protein [Pseudomonadota bacterium]